MRYKKKSIFKTYPLFTKIIVSIMGFAIFAAVIASLVHLRMSYSFEIERLKIKLDRLEKEQIALLTSNLWSFDTKTIDIQLQSILSDDDLVYVEIKNDGMIQYFAGDKPEIREALVKTYQLVHQNKSLGEVSFFATTRDVKKHLFVLAAGSLGAQLTSIFFTCLFIVTLLAIYLSKPVSQILKFTNTIQLDNLDSNFSLNRTNKNPDEFDAIAATLNSMRRRLKEDIEEKQLIKNELASEQAFSDTLINSLPGIFIVLDEEYRIIRYNQAFNEMISSLDEIPDLNVFNLIDKRDHEKLEHTFSRVFEEKKSISLEALIINLDSSSIPFFLNCSYLKRNQSQFLICIGTDLRDRKKMEDNLRQAQKMESIGTLAGGIAHDFNNILSAIFGYTELATKENENNPKLKTYHESVMKAAKRARDLVTQILTFGRKSEVESIPLKISSTINETLKLLRSSIPTTIEIQSEIESEKLILSDPIQIHQIIMNLCTNAYQSMLPKGGVLKITLKDRYIKNLEAIQGIDIVPGEYLQLEISDTGSGMSAQVLENIFDPYFTTKEKGSGTGLGLAVVHGIIKRSKGYLLVNSKPGHGSSFTVYFPIFNEPHSQLSSTTQEILDLTGHESIMVVDDEEGIRNTMKMMLERNGYLVSVFGDGKAALEAFSKNIQAYDLIITDMTMPKMTGYEFGTKILILKKEIPIFICTGYSETISKQKCQNAGFKRFLQKPVDFTQLLMEIRKVLDEEDTKSDI